MKVEINIKDDKVDEFLKTCDEIIAESKGTNKKAWALAINLKKCVENQLK